MAKKRQAEEIVKKTVLTMRPEKLRSLLEPQIEAGKQLLQIPVVKIHSGGYSDYGFGGCRSTGPKYDKTQFNAFKTEFHQWLFGLTAKVMAYMYRSHGLKMYKELVVDRCI